MRAIQAHEVERLYANGRGVRGVSLEVQAGECYAVLGRNGSGKTTLTRLLAGLEPLTAGRLEVLGHRLGGGSRRYLARMGVALETSAHWEALTGRQNARFAARSYGLSPTETERAISTLFAPAGLAAQADEPVAGYSYGMRRKLSVVQALCHRPDLLVLDEPSGGVDAHFQVVLTEIIGRRCAEGLTTWIAGNDPDWTAGVATRVAFMDEGRIVAEGAVDELIAEVAPLREVRVTLAAVTAIPAPQLAGLRSFEQKGEELVALLERDAVHVAGLIEYVASQGGEVRSVEVLGSTLRDAFLAKTGRTVSE